MTFFCPGVPGASGSYRPASVPWPGPHGSPIAEEGPGTGSAGSNWSEKWLPTVNCQLSTVNCQNQLPIANHPTYQLDEPLMKVLPADLITVIDNFRLLQQKSTCLVVPLPSSFPCTRHLGIHVIA